MSVKKLTAAAFCFLAASQSSFTAAPMEVDHAFVTQAGKQKFCFAGGFVSVMGALNFRDLGMGLTGKDGNAVENPGKFELAKGASWSSNAGFELAASFRMGNLIVGPVLSYQTGVMGDPLKGTFAPGQATPAATPAAGVEVLVVPEGNAAVGVAELAVTNAKGAWEAAKHARLVLVNADDNTVLQANQAIKDTEADLKGAETTLNLRKILALRASIQKAADANKRVQLPAGVDPALNEAEINRADVNVKAIDAAIAAIEAGIRSVPNNHQNTGMVQDDGNHPDHLSRTYTVREARAAALAAMNGAGAKFEGGNNAQVSRILLTFNGNQELGNDLVLAAAPAAGPAAGPAGRNVVLGRADAARDLYQAEIALANLKGDYDTVKELLAKVQGTSDTAGAVAVAGTKREITTNVTHIFAAGGKLGYQIGIVTPYAMLQYANANVKSTSQAEGQDPVATVDARHHGMIAGVGCDVALGKNFSIGGAFQHLRFFGVKGASLTQAGAVVPDADKAVDFKKDDLAVSSNQFMVKASFLIPAR